MLRGPLQFALYHLCGFANPFPVFSSFFLQQSSWHDSTLCTHCVSPSVCSRRCRRRSRCNAAVCIAFLNQKTEKEEFIIDNCVVCVLCIAIN